MFALGVHLRLGGADHLVGVRVDDRVDAGELGDVVVLGVAGVEEDHVDVRLSATPRRSGRAGPASPNQLTDEVKQQVLEVCVALEASGMGHVLVGQAGLTRPGKEKYEALCQPLLIGLVGRT